MSDEEGVVPTSYEEPPESIPVEEFFRSAKGDDPYAGVPESIPAGEFFKGPETASRPGAYARGFAEDVGPAAVGLGAGILASAGTGALLGSTVGPWGTLAGGVIGGLAAGYGASKLRDYALEETGVRAGTGPFSERQRQTDLALYPYTREAGSITAGALGLRPGGNLVERGASGIIGAGAVGLSDYATTGEVDPYKMLMGGAAGVALPNVNKPFSNLVGRAAPRSWQPHMPGYEAPPPPEPPPPPPPEPPAAAAPTPLPGTGEGLPGTSTDVPPGVPPSPRPPVPNDPNLPGTGTGLPGTAGEPTPSPPQEAPPEYIATGRVPGTISPERKAAIDAIDRQIATASLNRDQHQPGDLIGLHDQWSTYHDNLLERRATMLHGYADTGTEASAGLGGPVPSRRRMDQFNDATTTTSGNATVNRPPPEDAGIGMGPAAAGNKAVATGAVDESKAAVRTAPGEPTVPSTPVVQGHAAPDVALALKANQPEAPAAAASPTPAAAPPAAPAASSPSAAAARPAARPVPTDAQKQAYADKIAQQVAQAQRMGSRDQPPTPRSAPAPAAEPAPAGIHPQVLADRLIKAAKGDPAEAIKFLDAQVAKDPALAQGMPVREARDLLAQRAATAPVTPARPAAAQAAIRGQRPAAKPNLVAEAQAHNDRMAVELAQKTGMDKVVGELARAGKTAKEISAALKGRLETNEVRAVRESLGIEPAGPLVMPGGSILEREPIAKRPTLTLPPKKETVGQKLTKAARKLAKSEEGSIDIGPAARRPTEVGKEQGERLLTGRYAPQALRPNEIASAMLGVAEGDARHALTLLNRKMTEHKGWALRRDVVEARNILREQVGDIPARPEPSPEVPVVPGKTRADLQPPRTELIPKKREYTPPGERTPQKVIDPLTGEVRETKVFREEPRPEPLHGLANYTPEEKLAFGDAIGRLSPEKQLEAMALTKAVPKEKVLANVGKMSDFLQEARTERRGEKRTASTGKKAGDLQDKAHREGILAAYDKAVADNPRPDREENLAQTIERATRIVKATNEGINTVVAQLTRERPKYASRFTGSLNTKYMDNPPPATKVVVAARDLLAKPNAKNKLKFDSEEILALVPANEVVDPVTGKVRDVDIETQAKGGMTGDVTETVTPEAERLAGPRYQPKTYPDSPTLTTDHAEVVRKLNAMSDEAHDMMQDRHKVPIEEELAKTKNPNKLWVELTDALIKAQDERNRYAHEPDFGTVVKTTPVSDRAGIARVEQTGRFKKTKPTDFQNLTEAEKKAAPVRGVQDVTVDTYRQIKAAIEEFFGKKALPGKLAKGEIGGPDPEKSAKWLQQAGRILGEIPHDYRGSLDVSKIFDWIDKVSKKFRPDREPMVPTGMTRLYKQGSDPWTIKAAAPNPTKYVDVPTNVVEQYRVDGLPGVTGNAAKRFSKRWGEEIAVPPDSPDRRVAVDPEDAGFVDHLRRLWADESGALDVSRMPAWIPNAGAKLRNMFARGAAPATQEYHDQLAARSGAHAMGEKIALDWNVKLRTDTVRVLEDADKLLAKAKYEDGKVPAQAAADLMRGSYEKNDLDALPARERKFWDEKVAPVVKLQKDLFNEVRDLSTKNEIPDYEKLVEPVNMGKGFANFLPRMLKRTLDVEEGYDPRMNRRNPLGMWKPSTRERDWQTVVQPNGERGVYHITDEGDLIRYRDGSAVTGDVIRKSTLPEDFNPRQVGSKLKDGSVIDHATVDELIAHGRDEKGRYTKNSFETNPLMVLANSINDLAYLRSRLRFIDKMRNDPEYQKHVTTDEKTAEERWGAGNIAQTMLPPLKRNWYPKQVAWAFDDTVRQGFNYGGNQFMEGASRFAQSALKPFYFIGPEVHVLNELDKLLIGRGFDNLNLPKTVRNFSGALADVRAQGPMASLIMEAGGNPMFLHAKLSRFVPNMARRLGVELQEKNWKLDPLFKAAGINTKAKYWEPTYQGSNKMMWWQSDVLHQMVFRDNLDRHGGGNKNWTGKFAELEKLQKLENPTAAQVTKRDELAAWQMDLARKSVVETEKIIDSYVVPTTFGKSVGLGDTDTGRIIQQFLTDPAIANFGRFSHGLLKTLINIGKNMAGQNENLSAGHSAALGFSQAAMLLGMANVVYPLLSKAYQQMPWAKPESEAEQRGITRVATIPSELYHKGIKDGWSKVAARAWSPSVPINMARTFYDNRDNVGRPIMESAGPGGWAAVPFQAAGHAFDQIVSPAGQVSRAYAQGGGQFAAQRFIESNFGVKTPSAAQVKYEQQRPSTEKRQGESRERHPRGVFDLLGNEARKLVRGYEEGGLVTATATRGVIPTSGR